MVVEDLIGQSVELRRKNIIQQCEDTARWVVEMSLETWEWKLKESKQRKLERLKKADIRRLETIDNIERNKRKEKAMLRSLEFKLKYLTVESEADSRAKVLKKRKNEWYHHEIKDKKIKLENDCCSWGSGGMPKNSENGSEFFDVCVNCWRTIGDLENNIYKSTPQTVPQDPLPTPVLETEIEIKNNTEIDKKQILGDTQVAVVVAKKPPRKQGKRVWAQKKNGLFGWKTEKRNLQASKSAQVKGGEMGQIKPMLAESETGLDQDGF